ncbi:MAG: methionyl-tRNA formyltransferase [Clostridia bacterium]|nr:methionyl-tRNA formyltransferase [Clostridia bacterium]
MSLKVVFMGTPDIAAQCLQAVIDAGHNVVGVVTQPDKPKGRGYELAKSAVKLLAEEKGLSIYQPETLRDGAFLPTLEELSPDIIIVVAYGKILPTYVLEYPKYKCINVHGSVLPKYRGAAPIQRAIIDGEKETGITIIRMDDGIDTGDMLLIRKTPITDDETFETLHDKLAALGGETLVEALKQIEEETAVYEKQDDSLSNYAQKITKEDCKLDFSRTADELSCQIRGLSPFPLAFTKLPDARLLKIVSAHKASGSTEAKPGTIVSLEGGFEVACGGGTKLKVTGVLPEGKGRMKAEDFVHGRRIALGDMLKWEL